MLGSFGATQSVNGTEAKNRRNHQKSKKVVGSVYLLDQRLCDGTQYTTDEWGNECSPNTRLCRNFALGKFGLTV